MPFSSLGLSAVLSAPLARKGYASPTPVQSQSIPLVLGGRDLVARAQTGTGKTAAFGLPMLHRLLSGAAPRSRAPRGLVLVPTRELALQVHQSLETYGAAAGARVTVIVGGVGMRPQVQNLQRGTDVVVATPGRLIDHIRQRTIDLSKVEILTLDEADRMLDMGFLPPLRAIAAALPRVRQTLLFSATLPPEVLRLSAEFTREPAQVDVSPGETVPSAVVHRAHPVAEGRKRDLLVHVLRQPPAGQALVFCRTKRGSDRVGELLARAGISTAVIHGNKSQNARNRALSAFSTGRVSTLVATDIAARGLDIPDLPLVVNYDLPLVAEDYVHRVGRTGRAGRAGRAISLVSGGDREPLRLIQRLIAASIEQVPVEGFADAPGQTEPAPAARHDRPVRPGPRGRSRPPSRGPGRHAWSRRPQPSA